MTGQPDLVIRPEADQFVLGERLRCDSGWQYRDWRGGLYPAGLAQRRWLEHYASQYLTVENNNTFYRLPAPQTFADWRARTPGDFVMTVKASRYLTHVRRLRDPAEPVARLLAAAADLGPKLGPILLQLPPTLAAEPARLADCLAEFRRAPLPGGHGPPRIAVEPRHASWWTGEVEQILAAHDAALCWADRRGRPVTPLWRPAAARQRAAHFRRPGRVSRSWRPGEGPHAPPAPHPYRPLPGKRRVAGYESGTLNTRVCGVPQPYVPGFHPSPRGPSS